MLQVGATGINQPTNHMLKYIKNLALYVCIHVGGKLDLHADICKASLKSDG
jgi:hypothetical protein